MKLKSLSPSKDKSPVKPANKSDDSEVDDYLFHIRNRDASPIRQARPKSRAEFSKGLLDTDDESQREKSDSEAASNRNKTGTLSLCLFLILNEYCSFCKSKDNSFLAK